MDVKKLGNIYGFDGGSYAGNVYSSEYISPTINTMGGGNREPMIVAMRGRNPDNLRCEAHGNFQKVLEKGQVCIGGLQEHQVARTDGISPSLTAAMGMGGGQTPIINDCNFRIRKLTPLECWRLMGFSDEDFHKAESVNSNSQLYKQAGNSLVRVVMAAIMSQLNIKGIKSWNEMPDEERRKI